MSKKIYQLGNFYIDQSGNLIIENASISGSNLYILNDIITQGTIYATNISAISPSSSIIICPNIYGGNQNLNNLYLHSTSDDKKGFIILGNIFNVDETRGTIAINDNIINQQANLRVSSITAQGIGLISTIGLSNELISSDNSFAGLDDGTELIINNEHVVIDEILDENHCIINKQLNITNVPFIYKLAPYIDVNDERDVERGISISRNGQWIWAWNVGYNEKEEILYLSNYNSYKNILTISEDGHFLINCPDTYSYKTNEPPLNVNENLFSIYPQAFDKVYAYINNTFIDYTNQSRAAWESGFIAITSNSDYLYIGKYNQWRFTSFTFLTTNTKTSEIIAEFSTGENTWQAFSTNDEFIDNTNGFTINGTIKWSLTYINDVWKISSVNGDLLYWVRFKLTNINTVPIFDTISLGGLSFLSVYNNIYDNNPSITISPRGVLGLLSISPSSRYNIDNIPGIPNPKFVVASQKQLVDNVFIMANNDINKYQKIILAKSRGSLDNHINVENNDILGSINAYGYYNNQFIPFGKIEWVAENAEYQKGLINIYINNGNNEEKIITINAEKQVGINKSPSGFDLDVNNSINANSIFTNNLVINNTNGILKSTNGIISTSANLNDLNDINIISAINNEFLKFNGEQWINSYVTASAIKMRSDVPGWDTIQDWTDATQGSGKVMGGELVDLGNGRLGVSGGGGAFKRQNYDAGETTAALWNNTILENFDINSVYYIYVDYNNGSPIVSATKYIETLNGNTQYVIGKILYDGNKINTLDTSVYISSLAGKTHTRAAILRGLERGIGAEVSAVSGTRKIQTTHGLLYYGNNQFYTTSKNTNINDTFTYYYRDGNNGFIVLENQTEIDNLHYDNGSGTLTELSNNYYGVHWVFIDTQSNIHILYGTNNYSTLSNAQLATLPTNIPPIISNFCVLSAKIIIQKNANVITEIISAYDKTITFSQINDHNQLSGLQGGILNEFYHLTYEAYNYLKNQNQELSIDSTPQFAGLKLNNLNGVLYAESGYISGNAELNNLINVTANNINGHFLKFDQNINKWTNSKITNEDLPNNINTNLIANGNVTNIEFEYLAGVTSNIQEQINAKENNIPIGTTAQYYRGDKTWQILDTSVIPENGNLYYTEDRFNIAFSNKSISSLKDININELQQNNTLIYNGEQWVNSYISASAVKMISDVPGWDTVQHWANATQGAGRVYGGQVFDLGNGMLGVSGGGGAAKRFNDPTSDTIAFTWNSTILTGFLINTLYIIYVDYNNGNPFVDKTYIHYEVNGNNKFSIARVIYDGNTFTTLDSGPYIYSLSTRSHNRAAILRGVERAQGAEVGYIDNTLYITVNMGMFYYGNNEFITPAKNTQTGDTFTYYYRNGNVGWIESANRVEIDNTHYDNGSNELAILPDNTYGIHWVFIDCHGNIAIFYGYNYYNSLNEALNATFDIIIPNKIFYFYVLAAKIIVLKNSNTITTVQSAYNKIIEFTSISDHNQLSNLQGGIVNEYYHLNSNAYQYLQNQNQYLTTDSYPTFAGLTLPNHTGVLKTSNGTILGNAILNDIYDVTINSPNINQYLKYNGTTWTNSVILDTDIPSLTGYLKRNGSVTLTNDWNTGNYKITTGSIALTGYTLSTDEYGITISSSKINSNLGIYIYNTDRTGNNSNATLYLKTHAAGYPNVIFDNVKQKWSIGSDLEPYYAFKIANNENINTNTKLTILYDNGYVGINNNVPLAQLHIEQTNLNNDVLLLRTISTGTYPNYYIRQGKVITTNNTATNILVIPLNDNTNYLIEARFAARRTDAAGRAAFIRIGCFYRQAGGAATIQGTVSTPFTQRSNNNYNANITTSGNNVLVQVTGDTGNTVSWSCTVIIQDIST